MDTKEEKLMKKILDSPVKFKGEGRVRVIWMFSGTILFLGGMIFQNAYLFVGGMFLMIFTLISKFPDD